MCVYAETVGRKREKRIFNIEICVSAYHAKKLQKYKYIEVKRGKKGKQNLVRYKYIPIFGKHGLYTRTANWNTFRSVVLSLYGNPMSNKVHILRSGDTTTTTQRHSIRGEQYIETPF